MARWREAGAWWQHDPPLEVRRYRDDRGKLHEEKLNLPPYGLKTLRTQDEPNHREDFSLRPRKLRDEKVSLACGYKETPFSAPGGKRASYVPLHNLSGYSFGQSVLFARELPRLAASHGMEAAALTDRFSLAGAMEFAREAKACGIKPLIGAEVELECGGKLVLIARDKAGYASLSQFLTRCHLGQPRLHPLATWQDLEGLRGVLCLTGGHFGPVNRLLGKERWQEAERSLERLKRIFGASQLFVQFERTYVPWERRLEPKLLSLADRLGLTAVAANPTTHRQRNDFPAQDVLACSQTLCTVEEIFGRKPRRDPSQPQLAPEPARFLNGERFFRSPKGMQNLFADRPELIENTRLVADRCDEDVLPARAQLPRLFEDPAPTLYELAFQGARRKYGDLKGGVKRRLEHELARITRLNFADHFLVCWDLCRWAREQEILFSGRGSAVDSFVSYCLGFSRIDAYEHNLLFDRFLPEDGSKRPDIDIDFEAFRRDDARNYLIQKYGKDNVATVAAFGAFNTRGIIREVGKALELPETLIGFLAKRLHGGVSPSALEDALQKRPELRSLSVPKERMRWVFELAERLADVPRNARAHSSGVVVCDRPISETVPIMWSAGEQNDGEPEHLRIMQWDKRSAKHCFDKFDVLCLRGQDTLGGTQRFIRKKDKDFNVEQISLKDPETYRTMRSGELVGVPQSASPAMRQAHMRLQTQNLDDASLVQAGIRPGVGGAVKLNELIARRRGKPFNYEHPALEEVLGHTYGIVVFQEQVDQLLQVFAGYTGGQAEEIREEIHERRREDFGKAIHDVVVERIQKQGFDVRVAEQVFDLIAGFKGYGFAQGHALSFAEISSRSIYCQQHYPAEYFAALLNAQPAGYYGPCTLANEARNRGVKMLPPCVNRSDAGHTVEDVRSEQDPKLVFPSGGIRVPLGVVKGLSKNGIERILRGQPYLDFFDFVERTGLRRPEIINLTLCGALDSLHRNRRALLWALEPALRYAQARKQETGLDLPDAVPEIPETMTDFTSAEKAVYERTLLGLDIERHLVAFEREHAKQKGVIAAKEVEKLAEGQRAVVVGNPIRLRFPPTPSGKRVVFFDLEDESGLLNVTCFDATYRRDGSAIVCSPYITAIGRVQKREHRVSA
ncbi:MAG: DNA polymerase III subunit alpha [Fimbriimonadaceae bacterium]